MNTVFTLIILLMGETGLLQVHIADGIPTLQACSEAAAKRLNQVAIAPPPGVVRSFWTCQPVPAPKVPVGAV